MRLNIISWNIRHLIGRATVSVVPKPMGLDYEEAFELSDHRPVMITIKGL